MNRTLRRRFAALLALGVLVFAQLSVSAHACQRIGDAPAPAKVASATPAPCHDATDDGINLCDQHCQYGKAGFSKAQPPAAAFDTAVPALRVEPAVPCEAAHAPAAFRRPVPAAAPPPTLLFGVLRI